MSEEGTLSRRARIELNPWKNDYVCDACREYHGGLIIIVNGTRIDEDDRDGLGPQYHWTDILLVILAHLGVAGATLGFESVGGEKGSRKYHAILSESLRIENVIERSNFGPSETGLSFLREVLRYAGFEPLLMVNGIPHY